MMHYILCGYTSITRLLLICTTVIILFPYAEHIQRHIQEHHLPLSLIGFSYRGISVNECVHNAFLAVDDIL